MTGGFLALSLRDQSPASVLRAGGQGPLRGRGRESFKSRRNLVSQAVACRRNFLSCFGGRSRPVCGRHIWFRGEDTMLR